MCATVSCPAVYPYVCSVRFRPISHGLHDETSLLEHRTEQHAVEKIVFDDEDALGHAVSTGSFCLRAGREQTMSQSD
jgi:hypothetical protein